MSNPSAAARTRGWAIWWIGTATPPECSGTSSSPGPRTPSATRWIRTRGRRPWRNPATSGPSSIRLPPTGSVSPTPTRGRSSTRSKKSGLVTSAEVSSAGPQLEALLDEPAVAWVSATSDELALQASVARRRDSEIVTGGRFRRSSGVAAPAGLPGGRVVRLRGSRRRPNLRAVARPDSGQPRIGLPAAGRRARLRPRRPDQPLGRGLRRVRGWDVAVRPRRGTGARDHRRGRLGPDARSVAAGARARSRA